MAKDKLNKNKAKNDPLLSRTMTCDDILGKKKPSIHTPVEKIVIYGFIIIFMLLVLVPFAVLICSSISSSETIRQNGARPWVQDFSLDAYKLLFQHPEQLPKSYLYSIIITVSGTILNLVLTSMVAYATSRPKFKYGKFVSFFFSFTIMFQAGFIPSVIWYGPKYLNISSHENSIFALIFIPVFFVGHMVLLRAFYSGLPSSLYESAKIDGASEFKIFLKITTPLIVPGLATVAFYTVLQYWNDPSIAKLYTDENVIPISLYLDKINTYITSLRDLKDRGLISFDYEIPEDTMIYACAVASSGPVLCIFAAFQRFFVGGLTAGAVKE